MNFDFLENNVKTVARRAATYIQYRCTLGHNFALREYLIIFDPNLAYNLHIGWIILTKSIGERTGLVVRALDFGSGDPGSILGRVGVLFP